MPCLILLSSYVGSDRLGCSEHGHLTHLTVQLQHCTTHGSASALIYLPGEEHFSSFVPGFTSITGPSRAEPSASRTACDSRRQGVYGIVHCRAQRTARQALQLRTDILKYQCRSSTAVV